MVAWNIKIDQCYLRAPESVAIHQPKNGHFVIFVVDKSNHHKAKLFPKLEKPSVVPWEWSKLTVLSQYSHNNAPLVTPYSATHPHVTE